MKFWTTLAPMAALLLIVSCGGKKDDDSSSSSAAKDGFDSPKALVDDMLETQKKGSIEIADMVKYMAPEGRQEMAIQMVTMAEMKAQWMEGDEKKAAALKSIKDLRAKFNLPEKFEDADGLMEDKKKMKAAAAKYFKDVDAKAFLVALFELDVMKPESEDKDGEKKGPQIKEVKEIKEDGDKATVTTLLDNGKEEKHKLIKVDGRWYAIMD